MRKIIFLLITIVAVVVSGCKNREDNSEIQFVAILPLSGSMSWTGIPKKNAMELAVEEIKKEKEIDINLIFEDNRGNAKDGISAVRKVLSNKNNKYLYIDLTTVVNACIPIVEKDKRITFVGTAVPNITKGNEWIFRIFAGGDHEIEMIADYLIKNNFNKVFVIHTNEFYGQKANEFFQDIYTNNQGIILGKEEYEMGNNDFKEILTKAKASNPDKIVLLGYGNEYNAFIQQASQLGITANKFMCNLGGASTSLQSTPAELLEGLTFVGPSFTYLMYNNKLDEKTKLFVDEYTRRFKKAPDFMAAYAYDVISILSTFWNRTSDIHEINKLIRETKSYEGVSGKLSFNINGDSNPDLMIGQYSGGKIIKLSNER